MLNNPRIEYLKKKASGLPQSPGVYIMKNADGKIIYVGKSRCLKNRVSSYFTDLSNHTVKTLRLVDKIYDFDTMLTGTEIEALTLENRLIKLHTPKFNIRLKDSKSYPYIKLNVQKDYPNIEVVRKRLNDGAKYFGPYSGTSVAYSILNTVRRSFAIPDCKKKFPEDFGSRPCLNYQIGVCCGLCTGNIKKEDYKKTFKEVGLLLSGNFADAKNSLKESMEFASENLMFEAAAKYRDRINMLSKLWEKQRIVGSPDTEQDVFGIYSDESGSCISVYYVRNGAVTDSENFLFGADKILDTSEIVSFLFELYNIREYIPREILFGFKTDDEDFEALHSLLREKADHAVRFRSPEIGDGKALCNMVEENAKEYLRRKNEADEKDGRVMLRLAKLLGLEVLPEKIEAYDISNIGNENITAGKIVFSNGKFDKSQYRTFNIQSTNGQDDYSSMKEVIARRLSHTEDEYPDLILLDGGKTHVSVVRELMKSLGVDIPVFGMVKDEFHKTRALTDDENEISIAHEQSVFITVYKIQEEVHRFTVSKMSNAKRKTLKKSVLEEIEGIGPVKAKKILHVFGGLNEVKKASMGELQTVPGLTETDAKRIYDFFDKEK